MQSFEHFDIISLVDKSINIVVVLFFTRVLRFIYVHFSLRFSENRLREKEKNKLRHSRHFLMLA